MNQLEYKFLMSITDAVDASHSDELSVLFPCLLQHLARPSVLMFGL